MSNKKSSTKKDSPITFFSNIYSQIKLKFTDFKFTFLVGLLLVGLSLFLAIAFFSFFFTGWSDRSNFDIAFWELIKNSDIVAHNWIGKWGAYFADLFINQWFGIASYSAVLVIGLVGFRIIGLQWLPIRKTILHAAIITIWVSIVMGFLFIDSINDSYLLLGGIHGYFMSKWFVSAIGSVGTVIILIISLIIYIAFTFENSLHFIKKKIEKSDDNGFINEEIQIETVDQNDFQEEITQTENNEEQTSAIEEEIIEEESTQQSKEFERAADLGTFDKTIRLDDSFEITPALSEDEEEEENHPNSPDLTIEKIEEEDSIDDLDAQPTEDYDPTLDLSGYKFPSFDLLEEHKIEGGEVREEELIANKNKIVNTLEDYKIQIKSIKATVGPTVTLYEIIPAPGVRISKIKNLEDDIALSLAALGIRIIAPIPGRGTIGIEVPNSEPEVVSMRSIISSKRFQSTKYELPIALGKTISNETFVFDLAKAPHMLVAGATGQGKSVGLNAIITSLLYKKHPSQLKFVLVDPKKVELNIYSKLEKHFLSMLPDAEEAIITDVQKVVNTLNSLTIEMDNRYDLLKKAHARNLKEYNHKFIKRGLNPEKGHRFLPYIVVIIDEFADLIMTAGKEVEMPIARIAQLARAVGIHMIVATQRPSTNIITGVIKANFPTRVAFKVASMIDSRTILDSPGANQLIGRGDMLISQGSDLIRVQCAFVDTPEVEKITEFIGNQRGYATAFLLPEYVSESSNGDTGAGEVDLSKKDSMFEEAARIIVANQSGSTSLIQRRFSIGYNRAGRIIDQLEAAGIVGPFEGSKARQVLVNDEVELERILSTL